MVIHLLKKILVDLNAVSATSALGQITISATAVVTLNSVSAQFTVSSELILRTVSAELYERTRTVYVDFKDSYISNIAQVEEQNRVVQIPEKQHNARSKTLLAA